VIGFAHVDRAVADFEVLRALKRIAQRPPKLDRARLRGL
jgi:hypothetical protein